MLLGVCEIVQHEVTNGRCLDQIANNVILVRSWRLWPCMMATNTESNNDKHVLGSNLMEVDQVVTVVFIIMYILCCDVQDHHHIHSS